jgi:hypothetical protein
MLFPIHHGYFLTFQFQHTSLQLSKEDLKSFWYICHPAIIHQKGKQIFKFTSKSSQCSIHM